MKPSVLVPVALLAFLSACTEPLGPSQFAGTYQLTGVNGVGLPVSVASRSDGCSTQLSFGRLYLADGSFSFFYYSALTCPAFPTVAGMNSFGGGLTVQGH